MYSKNRKSTFLMLFFLCLLWTGCQPNSPIRETDLSTTKAPKANLSDSPKELDTNSPDISQNTNLLVREAAKVINQATYTCKDLLVQVKERAENHSFCKDFHLKDKECQAWKEFLTAKAPVAEKEAWVALVPWFGSSRNPPSKYPLLWLVLKTMPDQATAYADILMEAGARKDEEAWFIGLIRSFDGTQSPTSEQADFFKDMNSLFDIKSIPYDPRWRTGELRDEALCVSLGHTAVLLRQMEHKLYVFIRIKDGQVLFRVPILPMSQVGQSETTFAR